MLFYALDALHVELSAGLPLFLEKCSKCGADHLDLGGFARKAYKNHMYTCGAKWVG